MHDKTSIHSLFLFIIVIVFGFVFDFCIQFLLPCGCVAYAFYGIFVVFQLRSSEKINQTFYISHALPPMHWHSLRRNCIQIDNFRAVKGERSVTKIQ